MHSKRPTSVLKILKIVLLCLSVVGIWYVYKGWINAKRARLLSKLSLQLQEANLRLTTLLNFERYFAFRNEELFLMEFETLRSQIPVEFERLDLEAELRNNTEGFVNFYDQIKLTRENYNNEFVTKKKAEQQAFFNNLENYPLSDDQIEAVIRDEDNNLVIAGAGTGKTTTISAKVAYLLKNGLAKPEELLIISFTKNAVKEMHERCLKFCGEIPDSDKLDVKTFNSFGYLVKRHCSANELHVAFGGDEEAAKVFLQNTFDDLFLNDSAFRRNATNFIAFFNRPERDEFAFESMNDYLKHEDGFKNETLNGKKMKSKEEVQIANFFCLFGINYEYEKHYPLEPEDRNPLFGSYHPDFYLTDHGIWHEHFGIDSQGNVPDWFGSKPPYSTPTEYYQAGIAWKQGIHTKYQTKLIESYSSENAEGTLIRNLKRKLTECGIELKQRTEDELLPLVKESTHYEDFINLIHIFLGLMKSNGKLPQEIYSSENDKRLKVFMSVFTIIYQRYQEHLQKTDQIDYNDMVNQSAEHFNAGNFKKPYKYILVDEFQDMSLGRYALIKSIKKQNPAAKLYAVGDDWQSIFRFTGSDISIITEFEKHFGFTSQTSILKTYRFNDEILKISSDFIQKNPAQLRKTLFADSAATDSSFSFIGSLASGSKEAYQSTKEIEIRTILDEINILKPNASIFLIGRYHHNKPARFRALTYDYPNLKLEYYTAHRVKGMTCDYAILMDMDAGTLGFPSEIADDPLLNNLLHEGDKFENAEERRVFYVAITRAKHKNFLLYNLQNPSKFITELMEDLGDKETLADKCPKCKGILIRRQGPYSEFLGCTNYPRCDARIPLPLPSQPSNPRVEIR